MTLLQPSLIIVQPQTYNLAFSNNLFYPVYSSFPTYSVSYSIPTNSYQPSFFQPSYSSPYLPTYPLSYPSYSTSYLAYSPNLVQYSNYQNSYCSSSLSQQPNSQTFSNYQVPLYPSPNPTLNYVNFPEIKKMDNFSNPIQIEGSYQNLSLQEIANNVPSDFLAIKLNNLRDVACQTDNNSDQVYQVDKKDLFNLHKV